MTQTIEQLQARVAELEAENARLKAASFFGKSKDIHALAEMVLSDCGCSSLHWPLMEKVENRLYAFFDEQLISAQVEIKRLRDALDEQLPDRVIETLWQSVGISTFHHDGDQAKKLHHFAANLIEEFRFRLPSISTDTSTLDAYVAEKVKEALKKSFDFEMDSLARQRDLAVEALEAIAGRRIFIDNLASNVDIAVMTLDAIKESEVK